jgi:hypothetical protein
MLNRIVLLSVVSLLAVATGVRAQTNVQGVAEHFTFSPAEAPKSGLDEGRLPLVITRWSTDAERDEVFQALSKKDTDALAMALRSSPFLGYLRWPGGLEYTIRFARTTSRAGGEDVTLIVDRPVWVWWKPEVSLHGSSTPYTVVQLRFDGRGGEGKLAALNGAAPDKQAGVLVADYAGAPALITDVKRDGRS